jgi:hypothetical protein
VKRFVLELRGSQSPEARVVITTAPGDLKFRLFNARDAFRSLWQAHTRSGVCE